MDAASLAFVLGWGGGALGLIGGLAGTWASLNRTRSASERRIVSRWALGFWAGIGAFLLLLFWLPVGARWLPWIAYPPVLIGAIRRCNEDVMRVRLAETGRPT
ncbi:MAG: hypothetical protein U0790_16550 [Isosphaeraceae bacterium]